MEMLRQAPILRKLTDIVVSIPHFFQEVFKRMCIRMCLCVYSSPSKLVRTTEAFVDKH